MQNLRRGTALLALALWMSSARATTPACAPLFQIVHDASLEALYKDARSYWSPSQMSDPRHHNPNDFNYLVSMVSYRTGVSEARGRALIGNPDLLTQDAHFSTSYISSKARVETFMGSSFGVIVNAPEQNIFAASPRDLIEFDKGWFGFKPSDASTEAPYLRRILNEVGIKHPSELRDYRGPRRNAWNEVVVESRTPEGGEARVSGLVIVHSSESEMNQSLEELSKNYTIIKVMQKTAAERGLPIVRILRK